jgi:DNA-binding transcriptional LysR family regulator
MISMNLSWLDDFRTLAESGNFSRAAEERHMTQPAFSRRIRALEEWLGTDLFDRSSQPATLTPAGVWFQGVAQDLTSRVLRLPGEARGVADAHATTLRFAATHALSFTFMPGWLRGLEMRHSAGPISLVSDVLARCESQLLQGDVQFVLCHAHPQSVSELEEHSYPSARVGTDVLLPVSAPDAKGKPRHSLWRVAEETPAHILSYSAESGLGRILRGVHGAALDRYATQNVFTAHLASVLRTMALDGRGLAWLPRTLVAEDLQQGRLLEAAPPESFIELEVRLYRERGPLGTAAENFWQAVLASTL